MTIWREKGISSKQSTMLDVFLKSSLHVPGHLFLICGAVMFVQQKLFVAFYEKF